MVDENDHSGRVNAWMARAARGLPSERLLDIFERGFGAMWRRAHQTLGDVTLTAIADRVIYSAKERFSALSGLEVEAAGLQCKKLHERAGSLERDELAEGIRFVLVEFLTVLGNLTAEILSPALHAELAKVGPEERAAEAAEEEESSGELQNPDRDGEGAES